jgi:hypothetical protein
LIEALPESLPFFFSKKWEHLNMTDCARPVKFIEHKSKWVVLFSRLEVDGDGGSVREVVVVVAEKERTCLTWGL